MFVPFIPIYTFGVILVGMVSAMDEAIGNITEALKAQGMFENTLILFTADVSKHP